MRKEIGGVRATERNFLKHILGIIMALALVVVMIPAIPGEAASTRSRALAAYRKKLSGSTVTVLPKGKKLITKDLYYVSYKCSKRENVKFTIANIDNNNVPELVLEDPKYGYGIWTYRNGKVTCVRWEDSYGEPYGYYRKKGIFVNLWHGIWGPNEKNLYYLKNGKMKQKWKKFDGGIGDAAYYTWTSPYWKEISWSSFNRKRKVYVGSSKLIKFKMHKNTSGNRKKYLK